MSHNEDRPALTDVRLKHLYLDDRLTMREIAEKYRITYQRIQQRLAGLGIHGVSRRREIDSETLRTLYVDSRLTKAQTAEKLGVSKSKVETEIRRHGIRRPNILEHLKSIHSREDIEGLYIGEGVVQTEAAKHLGMSIRNFRALLRHFGIEHRYEGIPYSRKPRRG